MEAQATAIKTPRRYPGRLHVALGLLIPLLGIVFYFIQIGSQRLTIPWYAPLFGFMGLGLLLLALIRAWSWWRIISLVFVSLLVVFELLFLLKLSTLPPYTGPVAAGKPFPAFATSLSDGTSFNQDSLKGDQATVLVFFRCHW